MKTLFWGALLAGWLALAVGEVRGGAMYAGANGSQQFNGATSSGVSQQPFIGRGYGFEGNPTPMAQFAQPGHSIVRTSQSSNQDQGNHHGGFHSATSFGHRGDFGHDHFGHHRHSIVVFVNGAPFWYPAYTDYPCYYGGPPPVVSSSAVDTTDSDSAPPPDYGGTDSGNAQPSSDYSDLGASWGQDLRREVTTWDQFVAYLKAYIIMASPPDQVAFREAFINAYRINGAAAYDKAAVEAAGAPTPPPPPTGPKIITMPPPQG